MFGNVFDIQRSSFHDGPGIRTTVFLKGCPLRCKWCHNPESLKPIPQLLFNSERCISCMACINECPNSAHIFSNETHIIDRSKCMACGKCTNACLFNALEIKGHKMTVDEVMNIVIKDIPYYQTSGGGLTISGGEPTMQYEFLIELLKAAKKHNIHTCIETSGFCNKEKFETLCEYLDCILFDYKCTNEEKHIELTGVSNKQILENLDYTYKKGLPIYLRCPMIAGINDCPEHFEGISNISKKYPNLASIEIMPYHNLGISKSERLNEKPEINLPNTDEQTKQRWLDMLHGLGCNKAAIG